MDTNVALRRLALGAALATVVASSFAYTGAVTTGAFVAFVLVAVAGSGLVAALIGQPQQVGGLIAGLGGAVFWSVAVNALSGETSGPVARSSAVCGVTAACAVYSARRLWIPPFLASVALGICGAMYYGAAGEVRYVALITSLLALATTAALDAARHRRRVRKPRLIAVLVGLVVAAAFVLASVGAEQVLSRVIRGDRATVSALVQPESIRPPWAQRPPVSTAKPPVSTAKPPVSTVKPPVSTVKPPVSTVKSPTSTVKPPTSTVKPPTSTVKPSTTVRQTTTVPPRNPQTKPRKKPLDLALIITLLFLALLLLVLSLRLWLGKHRLQRWKRRLQRLPPAESAAASWSWMVFELNRLGWAPSENPSIDRTAHDMLKLAWPEAVQIPAAQVAERGAVAAFGSDQVSVPSATESWSLAAVAVDAARSSSKRWPRTRAVLRLLRT
ncbi:MAG: hypothetical protein WCH93_06750 [Actinomycetota bacterium]